MPILLHHTKFEKKIAEKTQVDNQIQSICFFFMIKLIFVVNLPVFYILFSLLKKKFKQTKTQK